MGGTRHRQGVPVSQKVVLTVIAIGLTLTGVFMAGRNVIRTKQYLEEVWADASESLPDTSEATVTDTRD